MSADKRENFNYKKVSILVMHIHFALDIEIDLAVDFVVSLIFNKSILNNLYPRTRVTSSKDDQTVEFALDDALGTHIAIEQRAFFVWNTTPIK